MEAAAEAWLSSDKRNCWPRDHTGGTVVIAAASYSPLVIAEVRFSTATASLVRVLPKTWVDELATALARRAAPVVRTAHTIADLE